MNVTLYATRIQVFDVPLLQLHRVRAVLTRYFDCLHTNDGEDVIEETGEDYVGPETPRDFEAYGFHCTESDQIRGPFEDAVRHPLLKQFGMAFEAKLMTGDHPYDEQPAELKQAWKPGGAIVTLLPLDVVAAPEQT